MVISRSGLIRFARAAALGPAADPPMMTSFSLLDIFPSQKGTGNFFKNSK
jgi:hypothetical protein